MKRLITKFAIFGLTLCTSLSAFSQGMIEGYFRVSNAETGKYVEVTGPFSADPTASADDAQYSAGTVIYVAADQPEGEYVYRVTSLRSQGIEVVGNYIDDYFGTLTDIILPEEGFKTDEAALWALVREGFKYGYTSIGRAAIQTMILIVATRLDDEKNIINKGELADFAKRFNTEVAQYIDLGIRLQPVEGKDNTFLLYYETPTLDCVSNWYKKSENKEIFEDGFEAMRSYLTAKMGLTGEGFDPSEVQEMEDWGYVLPDEYRQKPNSDGVFVVTYEEIFANPTLLFNWLKLNVIKFTDPERCPQIDLQGLWLPKFAEEMQKHRLTQQIISYLPSLQPNQKIFLCDGKNDVTGHFDFTSESGVEALQGYAQWVIRPIDNDNEKFMVKNNYAFEGKNYSAVYYDFPVSASDENTTVNTLSKEVFDAQGYAFVSLVPSETVDLQTALVVESSQPESQLNIADGKPIIVALTEPVTTPDNSFNVSDKVADKQYVRRKANEESSEETTTGNKNFTGILLSSMLSNLDNATGINPKQTDLYYFQGAKNVEALENDYLVFGAFTSDQNVGPNVILYTPYELSPEGKRVLIGSINIEVNVGETDTKHEDDDNSDVPEGEQAKVAQVFNGSDANTFKNLISFSVELTYGDDFNVAVTTPESVNDDEWLSPALSSDLNQSYKDAFLKIQPNPYKEGEDGYESYLPGLFIQYEDLFSSNSATDMTEDFVDGFYLASHLDADETAVLEDPTKVEGGEKTVYEYDLKFDAPCSGRYMVTVQPAENAPVSFESKTFYVKIVPNLYAKFGDNETPGFNISGYQFTEENGQYVIYLPKTVKDGDEDVAFDLTNLKGYTPGTYFASSITATAGEQVVRSKVRREAEGGGATAYYVKLPDLSDIANTSTPLSINIEKNGVAATYDFFIKTTTDGDKITGVDTIGADSNSEAIYYTLQGVKVANPEKGIYVKVQNGKATKVIL